MLVFSVVMFVLIFAAIIYLAAKSRAILSVDLYGFDEQQSKRAARQKKKRTVKSWEEIEQ